MSRAEQHALLAFVNAFKMTRKVTAFEQLADGKALMEMMSQIDGTHFKTTPVRGVTAPTASSSENWVLKMNTLKRLYRLLLSYPLPSPHPQNLGLTSLREPSFNSIARTPTSTESTKGLAQICRLCLAVGVWGSGNEGVIRRIQALPEGDMAELMRCIEDVTDTFPENVRTASRQSSPEKPGLRASTPSPPISGLREERDRLLRENDELRLRYEKMTEEIAQMTLHGAQPEADAITEPSTCTEVQSRPGLDLRTSQTVGSEVERLRIDLGKSEDNLAKMEADLEDQRKLVQELTKTVDDLKGKAAESRMLKDQLDEYRHTAERLQKSENVVEKYKKKLEDSAGLRRELRSLEEENSILVNTNATLEAQIKSMETKANVAGSTQYLIELEEKIAVQIADIAGLQHDVEEAQALVVKTSRLHERDLAELQRYQELGEGDSTGMQRDLSRLSTMGGDPTLGDELGSGIEEDLGSGTKAHLRLRIHALQRELALARIRLPNPTAETETNGFRSSHTVRQSACQLDAQQNAEDDIERENQLTAIRTTLADARLPQETQQQLLDIHGQNILLSEQVGVLKAEVALNKEGSADGSGFEEAQHSYEAQIKALRAELQSAQSNNLAANKRYKLEQQLMLSAWHELGSRTVRDHISATGNVRRGPRPVATSWLGRQRKHQEDAAFTRANLA